jgi:MtN3 and saliva related transmembrane protein
MVGYVAGTLATISFLPQLVKTVRRGSTKDISLGMYLLFSLGVALWLVYGIMLSAWPVIIANLVTLIFAGTLLVLKIKNG